MATTGQLLTIEDYERLPEEDLVRHELSEGELIVSPFPEFVHSKIAMRLAKTLAEVEKFGFSIYVEAGFRLGPNTLRGPDIAVIRADREPQPGEKWLSGAPEVAIEIVSPSNSAADLQQKTQQFLSSGGSEVWIVYPRTRTVMIYSRGERPRELTAGDFITSPLFPGWSCPVSALFE